MCFNAWVRSLTKNVFISPGLLLVFHCWPLQGPRILISLLPEIVNNTIVLLPPKPPILLMVITVLLAINELKPFNKLQPASTVGFHALC